MTNATLGVSQCSTCGRRKPNREFPRTVHPGVEATCLACIARTERLEQRAQRLRMPGPGGYPPEPLQLEVRRRLEHRTRCEVARALGCSPTLVRDLLRRRAPLDLVEADRWAHRLDSHLDLIWSAA